MLLLLLFLSLLLLTGDISPANDAIVFITRMIVTSGVVFGNTPVHCFTSKGGGGVFHDSFIFFEICFSKLFVCIFFVPQSSDLLF